MKSGLDRWRHEQANRAARTALISLPKRPPLGDRQLGLCLAATATQFNAKDYVFVSDMTTVNAFTVHRKKELTLDRDYSIPHESNQRRVCSLDSFGSMLVMGTTGSTINYYNMKNDVHTRLLHTYRFPTERELVASGVCKKHSTAYKIQTGRFNETSTQVNNVCIYPADPSKFLATSSGLVCTWDSSREGPPQAYNLYDTILSCACDSTCRDNNFMAGTADGSLFYIDTRQSSPVKHIPGAHAYGVCSLAWSPYIPFWVASGGNDAVVNVWDLRFAARPSLSMKQHCNSVQSISWSKQHCELLCSGSTDSDVILWSLYETPHHYLHTINELRTEIRGPDTDIRESASAILKVDFLPRSLCSILGLTTTGFIDILHLGKPFLSSLVASRSADHKSAMCEVERFVYLRKFTESFQHAFTTATATARTGQNDRALSIIELCYPKKIPVWTVSLETLPNKEEFMEDVSKYSYPLRYMPPRYREKYEPKTVAPDLLSKIKQFKLSLELELAMEHGSVEELASNHFELIAQLQHEKNYITGDLLKRLIQFSVVHDYLDTVCVLGPQYTQVLCSVGFEDFPAIAHMFLYPTIFETTEGQNEDLQSVLKTPNAVLEQIKCIKYFNDILMAPGPENGQRLMALVETQSPSVIVSLPINRLYLNALQQIGRYDKFLQHYDKMITLTVGCTSHEIFVDIFEQACKALVAQVRGAISPDPAPPVWETSQIQKALISLISLACGSFSKSMNIAEFFPDDFYELCKQFEKALDALPNNPDPSVNIPGDTQAIMKCEKFLSDIACFDTSSRPDVNTFVTKLCSRNGNE